MHKSPKIYGQNGDYMKTGIVFEGGAFRTIFSCGVMDAMIENDIIPDYMIGVSAGAAYGVSMASKQAGRNIKMLMEYRNDSRYVGINNMLDKENRSLYGLDFAYDTIPNVLLPFDYDEFKRYKGEFYCVVTNINTGEAEYLPYTGDDRTNVLLRATCALPLLFPPIEIDGKKYMDGGITDSIPYEKALADGCDRVLVVLTREKGYIKRTSSSTKAIARKYEATYPALSQNLMSRAVRYNESVRKLAEYEASGKVMVIRPTVSKGFGRIEKDKFKILSMYNDGYNKGYKLLDEIKNFYDI